MLTYYVTWGECGLKAGQLLESLQYVCLCHLACQWHTVARHRHHHCVQWMTGKDSLLAKNACLHDDRFFHPLYFCNLGGVLSFIWLRRSCPGIFTRSPWWLNDDIKRTAITHTLHVSVVIQVNISADLQITLLSDLNYLTQSLYLLLSHISSYVHLNKRAGPGCY